MNKLYYVDFTTFFNTFFKKIIEMEDVVGCPGEREFFVKGTVLCGL